MEKVVKRHSKFFTITISSIVILLFATLATFCGFWFGYSDPDLSKKMNYDPFYSTWMSNLNDEAKITEVVIPGAHDAGTKYMIPQALCQGHTIKEQLEGGVRYFDIRVAGRGDDLVIFHGPILGQNFIDVANQFSDFIAKNPTEFIIIDFQHLGENVNARLIETIKELLPIKKMLPSSHYQNISNVNMQELRQRQYNFLITWTNEKEALTNNFFYRNAALRSEYNGDKHKESDEALIAEFDNYYKNAESEKLFVLQAQRTAKTILGKPCMYEKGFKPKANEFISNIKNDVIKLNKTNIIMRDFIISDPDNINTILSLNLNKNLIKASAINTYSSFVL